MGGLAGRLEDYAAVMIGGALGAVARWRLSAFIDSRASSLYPWGTLAVNLLGSFFLGFVMGASAYYGVFSRWERLLLATGFAGAFTTFSTFMYESFVLLSEGPSYYGLTNIVSSVVLGLAMVYAGLVAAGVVYGRL